MDELAKKIFMMAYREMPPPDDWDLSDLKLYHSMRLLYAEFAMLLVDRDRAVKERAQLLAVWYREKEKGEGQ